MVGTISFPSVWLYCEIVQAMPEAVRLALGLSGEPFRGQDESQNSLRRSSSPAFIGPFFSAKKWFSLLGSGAFHMLQFACSLQSVFPAWMNSLSDP